MRKYLTKLFSALILTLFLGCGGSSTSKYASPNQVQYEKSLSSLSSKSFKGEMKEKKKIASSESMKEEDSSLPNFSKKDKGLAAEATEQKLNLAQDKGKEQLKEEIKKAREVYLSADDSNSEASPVIVRKMILNGKYVPSDLIRTYEFLNYYTFNYSAPENQPLRIFSELRQKEKQGEYSLQAVVRSGEKTIKQLKAFNVTFLIDLSGSMAGEPFKLAKKMILGLTQKLKKGSLVSIVVCNRDAKVILDSHRVNEKSQEQLSKLLNQMNAEDITNLEKGIHSAYKQASKNYSKNYLNRVIVLSDGATNAGNLSKEVIAKYAEDSNRVGIYLCGIGLGEGFNDELMNTFTDKGKGAYLFIDSEKEIERILSDAHFISSFDLALKNIRLKMRLPEGWQIEEFHGEQISTQASEIIPQYLAPNDQMIYHMTLMTQKKPEEIKKDEFFFESEYTTLEERSGKLSYKTNAEEMLKSTYNLIKSDAIVEFAEMLKKIKYPLEENKSGNLKDFEKAYTLVQKSSVFLKDKELIEIVTLMEKYKKILEKGEVFPGSRDKDDDSIGAVLGINPNQIKDVQIFGDRPDLAVKTLPRLLKSVRLVPQEGYKFLLISSGPVGNPYPAGGGSISGKLWPDPTPDFMGYQKAINDKKPCYDYYRVVLKLKAPKNAKSFSFDFNFFSAEYPNFVKKSFNDSFYAVLEAKSTNDGKTTNISFDSNYSSIEVDNNYFENDFHPIPNIGTGFDQHGSTGWLRTSWPIQGGEEFTLTFSVHDEGDGIYDSLAVIDNFQFHDYNAVGTTDPLN